MFAVYLWKVIGAGGLNFIRFEFLFIVKPFLFCFCSAYPCLSWMHVQNTEVILGCSLEGLPQNFAEGHIV